MININHLIYNPVPLFRFGLFEAMSAIEMMDVKMDAGMMCNQISRQVMDLPHSIEVQSWALGLPVKTAPMENGPNPKQPHFRSKRPQTKKNS